MIRFRTGAAVCAAAGLCAFVLAGCAVSGGGWMPGKYGGKATFGFSLTCDENSNLVGDWTYHDKGAGVDIAGTVTADDAVPCGSITEVVPYRAQHCSSNCTGSATITVTDSGDTGRFKGDHLSVSLSGGVYAGYSNSQNVQGGNLVIG
jgi:hypothetical protein